MPTSDSIYTESTGEQKLEKCDGHEFMHQDGTYISEKLGYTYVLSPKSNANNLDITHDNTTWPRKNFTG